MRNVLSSLERAAAIALSAAESGRGPAASRPPDAGCVPTAGAGLPAGRSRASDGRDGLRDCFPDGSAPSDGCLPGSPAPDDGCFPGGGRA